MTALKKMTQFNENGEIEEEYSHRFIIESDSESEPDQESFVLDTRFQKQSECFAFADEKQFKNPIFYALDRNDTGSKTYGVCEVDKFIIDYLKVEDSHKNFYEILKTDRPRRECYDIELEWKYLKQEWAKDLQSPKALYENFLDLYNDFNHDEIHLQPENTAFITDSTKKIKTITSYCI